MTKSHSTPPKMGNNGGTAFVRINGKRIYLGKFGSPEAAQNYAQCIAEWAVGDVAPGQPEAPESTLRTDIPDAVVDATLPHLLPTVAVMVQVQRLATMRPNEICRMRVGGMSAQFSFVCVQKSIGEFRNQ